MQGLLSYRPALEEGYAVRSVKVRIMEIVRVTMLSYFMDANTRATYVRYIRVEKVMIKHEGVLSLSMTLSKEDRKAKSLGITHLEDTSLYISPVKLVLLMIQAANRFVKNDHKPGVFYKNYFYRHTIALFNELRAGHL